MHVVEIPFRRRRLICSPYNSCHRILPVQSKYDLPRLERDIIPLLISPKDLEPRYISVEMKTSLHIRDKKPNVCKFEFYAFHIQNKIPV
jgi:hypothetical protein